MGVKCTGHGPKSAYYYYCGHYRGKDRGRVSLSFAVNHFN